MDGEYYNDKGNTEILYVWNEISLVISLDLAKSLTFFDTFFFH